MCVDLLDADRLCVIVLELVALLSEVVVADCVELDRLVVVALVPVLTLTEVHDVVADCVLVETEVALLAEVVLTEVVLTDVVVADCVLLVVSELVEDDCSSQVSKQNKPSRSPNVPTAISTSWVWKRNR